MRLTSIPAPSGAEASRLKAIEDRAVERMESARDNFKGWCEPNGLLVPTEPDAGQRALVRMRLAVQIVTLAEALGFQLPADEAAAYALATWER